MKKKKKEGEKDASDRRKKVFAARTKDRVVDEAVASQFKTGRLYAKVTSRPGQCGRADGYVLEGEELNFYSRKIAEKKKK